MQRMKYNFITIEGNIGAGKTTLAHALAITLVPTASSGRAIPVPAGVSVDIKPGVVAVTGPKGSLSERISADLDALALTIDDQRAFAEMARRLPGHPAKQYQHGARTLPAHGHPYRCYSSPR